MIADLRKSIGERFRAKNLIFFGLFFAACNLFFISNASAAGLVKPPNNLGLKAYYSFNDATGTKATDFSGNANTGTLFGGTTWRSAKAGQGLLFDGGTNTYVEATTTMNLNAAGTVSLWFNTSFVDGNGHCLFCKGDADSDVNGIVIFAVSGGVSWELNDASQHNFSGTSIPLTWNTWHHFALTWDGSNIYYYYDGQQFQYTQTITPVTTVYPIVIGSDPLGHDRTFSGLIDEVRVYNRALSQTEINALYQPQSSAAILKTPSNNGLKGYWNFEDATGTTATDFSGNGNTGTLVGSTAKPTWVSSKFGKGINVTNNINTQYMEATTTMNLNASGTVAVWFNADQLDGNQRVLFSKGDFQNDRNGVVISVRDSAGVTWELASASAAMASATGVPLSTGRWYQVVLTWDGVDVYAYLNGSQIDHFPQTLTPITTVYPIRLGQDNVIDRQYKGTIDEVRVYNRTLSATEVAALYSSTAAKVNTSQNTRGPQNGLVGLWSFDGQDLRATTAYDRSGQGNNGTLTNGPVPISGKIGQALSLDGVDDYVDAGNGSALNPTTAISVCTWINSINPALSSMIVNKDNSGSFQYTLRMNGTTGKVMFRATNSGLTSAEADGNTILSANTWYFACGTYDGSNVRVFVNGVEDGTAGTLTGTMPNNGANLTIGRRDDGFYFPGRIDDVRIYNRALSAAEVLQLYNLGK